MRNFTPRRSEYPTDSADHFLSGIHIAAWTAGGTARRTSAIEASAKRRPLLLPAATGTQTLELPKFPIELAKIEVGAPLLQRESGYQFGGKLFPEEEGPKLPQVDHRPARTSKPAAAPRSSVAKQAFVQAQVRSRSRPQYPSSARRMGEEGTTQIRLSIDSRGSVTSAAIFKSSGSAALDASALKAAARWKFKPASSGGRPISTKVVVPIRFDLK